MARFNFEKRLFTVAPDDIIETFVDACHMSINARPYGGEELRIEYYSSDEYPYTARVRDGIVILDCPQDTRPGGLSGMFGMIMTQMNYANWQDMPIDIYVPRSYQGMLNLCTSHAKISASNLELASRFHALTTNAAIELRGVLATALELKTSNAKVIVENVAAFGEPDAQGELQPTLSRIRLVQRRAPAQRSEHTGPARMQHQQQRVAPARCGHPGRAQLRDVQWFGPHKRRERTGNRQHPHLQCFNSTGPPAGARHCAKDQQRLIKGSIVGQLSDFAVDSHTTNAKNSLPSTSTGPRSLSAHTSNANISLEFVK